MKLKSEYLIISLLLIVLIVLVTVGDNDAAMLSSVAFWQQESNSTLIYYAEGNVTINDTLFFGGGGTINDNSSCLILHSPNDQDRIEICDNASIHFYADNTEVYTANGTDSYFNNFVGGDGRNLFNVPFNISDINTSLNITTYWEAEPSSQDIFYAAGNVTINNTLFAGGFQYPTKNGEQEGYVLTYEANDTIEFRPFELGHLADYTYVKNETGSSIAFEDIPVTTASLIFNASGGFYRGQAYITAKTALSNKAYAIRFFLNTLEIGNLTRTSDVGESWDFTSLFAGDINISAGENNLTMTITNLDNNLLTWEKARLEIMKVSD